MVVKGIVEDKETFLTVYHMCYLDNEINGKSILNYIATAEVDS